MHLSFSSCSVLTKFSACKRFIIIVIPFLPHRISQFLWLSLFIQITLFSRNKSLMAFYAICQAPL